MSEVLEFAHGVTSSAERRRHARQRPNSLTYIELEKDNGGIVLDASESGISVQAVVSLQEDVLPRVRLRLPDSKEWLEFRARVVWTREAGKVAGLELEDLSEPGRSQLHDWLTREASDRESNAPLIPEWSATFPSEADNADMPQISRAVETRPALALVDYTDQSGAEQNNVEQVEIEQLSVDQSHVGELVGNVRGEVPIAVAVDSGSRARRLSVPFSGISGAQERAMGVEAEEKQLRSAPKQPTARSAASPRQTEVAAWVYLLLLALAVCCVAAGWAVGRGKLTPTIEKLRGMVQQERASAATIETQPEKTVAPVVSEIEVRDLAGQTRMILLQAAAVPASALAAQSAYAGSTARKPALNFQVWTLSAPRPSASAGAAAASANSAPPAMPTEDQRAQAPQIAEIASGEATNGYAEVPRPENSVGGLQRGVLLHRVEPEYPEIARDQRVSGTVVLNAHLGADGLVRSVSVISGPKLLIAPAENAVRQWRYAPTMLDSKPIETDVQISLVFRLPGESE